MADRSEFRGVSRRDALKAALRAGAYTTPIILASVPLNQVAAATPAPGVMFTARVVQRPTDEFCAGTSLGPVLEQDVTVTLRNGLPNASLVLYLDSTLATGGHERFNFRTVIFTDAAGTASFSGRAIFIAAGFIVVNGVLQGFPTSVVANISQPGMIGNPLYSTPATVTNQQCP